MRKTGLVWKELKPCWRCREVRVSKSMPQGSLRIVVDDEVTDFPPPIMAGCFVCDAVAGGYSRESVAAAWNLMQEIAEAEGKEVS